MSGSDPLSYRYPDRLTLVNAEDDKYLQLFENLYTYIVLWESAQSKAIEVFNQIEDCCQELKCEWTDYRDRD